MGAFRKAAAVGIAILALAAPSQSYASFFGLPKALKSQLDHVSFKSVVLPPFGFTHFCQRYQDDCKEHGRAFRKPHPIALTPRRWKQLVTVNQSVNRSIQPKEYVNDKSYDTWRIGPAMGDCNDYAVTKRHELLAMGWPSRSVLLGEVVTSWGQHHLVLVVRTQAEDLVLDNLNANIKVWSKVPYQWVRIESPTYHGLWATIKTPTEIVAAL